MGDCQNYGPFLGPYYNTGLNTGPNLGDLKWDHNFDNPPDGEVELNGLEGVVEGYDKDSDRPHVWLVTLVVSM